MDEAKRDVFHREYKVGNELEPLLKSGLLELRPHDSSPKYYHPTERGIQFHDRLAAQGYDFAPPEGTWGVDNV